jgi:hypothetical protein
MVHGGVGHARSEGGEDVVGGVGGVRVACPALMPFEGDEE